MWKCVIDSMDLKTYEFANDNLKVCIEARNVNNFWEIYKTYHSDEITFTEESEANSEHELNSIINKMKQEVLDTDTLKNIDKLRKNLTIKMKRVYKEQNVEKWSFFLGDENLENTIIAKYGNSSVELDIILDEQLKFLETELLDEIFRVLGLNEFNQEVIQNVYFYSKRSNFYTGSESKDAVGKIEVGFSYEPEEN